MKQAMISKAAAEMGRKGGKIGGKRCLKTMTPAERIERARKAGIASGAARRKKAKGKA